MFPDEFFGDAYFANDFYPPQDALPGGGGVVSTYMLWAPWRGRHRMVS